MSVKGCYTDFHIDFGGTSVWYHVFKGSKVGSTRSLISDIFTFNKTTAALKQKISWKINEWSHITTTLHGGLKVILSDSSLV